MDLKSLAYPDLNTMKKEIESELKSRKSKILAEARAEIQSIAKKYGLSLEEILSGKQSKTTKAVAPKYRNPNNQEETWTGRGKRPVWVSEALAQGKTLEQLAI